MTQIPEEIKKQIEEKYPIELADNCINSDVHSFIKGMQEAKRKCAEYGYSLHPSTEWVSVEEKIKQRIKELNAADAAFCEARWDKNNIEHVRNAYREASNKVTFARQELEEILKLIPAPPSKP
jgi:hypothetical protein